MRRSFQFWMLCLAVGGASACSTPETIVMTEDIPTAGVRFINAVPDTNAMDFRFVDIVESNAHYNIGFRNGPASSGGVTASAQIQYKNTRAGQRHFRIFLSGNTAAVASFVLKDTTVTLEAGKLYTAMMWGTARSGGMKFVFYEETIPDPGTQVGLRMINTTSTPYEVRTYPATGTVPASATWTVPAFGRSTFVNIAPSQVRYNIQPVGGGPIVCCFNTATPPVLVDQLALIGQAASSSAGTTTLDIEALPGSTVAGSAITGIIFPPSVPGSNAAAFLNTLGVPSMGVTFMWDKRPPRPAGV